jgi:hypothetical protein
MRMLSSKMQMWKWTAALALAVAPLQAGAETLFRWTAEDGSVAYTDDAKRIPERYRPSAQTIQTGGITGYARYSPAKGPAQVEYTEQLAARVERLRELNRRLELDAAPVYSGGATVTPNGGGGEAYVRVGDNLALRVPTDGTGESPVVVQDVRVRRPDSIFTSTDTVVSQDGKVLLVVRGDRHSQNPSSDTLDEREFVESNDFFND